MAEFHFQGAKSRNDSQAIQSRAPGQLRQILSHNLAGMCLLVFNNTTHHEPCTTG
jgi:hypothetical protein